MVTFYDFISPIFVRRLKISKKGYLLDFGFSFIGRRFKIQNILMKWVVSLFTSEETYRRINSIYNYKISINIKKFY